jgi:hypothetical protein
MDRRNFTFSSLAGLASLVLDRVPADAQSIGFKTQTAAAEELFPARSLPELAWSEFTASGFSRPVCGMIHRKSKPAECGMPLGSIDTGCLDLDTDGTFGYCSIFGSFVLPRGPLKVPFLGLTVGNETWVTTSFSRRRSNATANCSLDAARQLRAR